MRLSPALWVLVDSLAVYRLTILVTRDAITARLRGWLSATDATGIHRPRVWDFLGCAWCTSIWIAGGVVVLTRLVPVPWSYVALVLAFSAAAGALSSLVRD